MPTINQLVREGRRSIEEKSKTPEGKEPSFCSKKRRLHPCWYHDT